MTSQTRTIYLHIGCGKTGTTAIQMALAGQGGAGQAATGPGGLDLLYPDAAGGGQGIGHDTFAKAFITTRPPYMNPPRNVDAELAALRTQISTATASRILISAEHLLLADPVRVRAFFDELGSGFAVRVILFVRSQDELVESEYNQLTKLGRITQRFADYANGAFDGDFHRMARDWAAVFGARTLQCRIYDARRPRSLEQILKSMRLDPARAVEFAVERRNESVGFAALSTLRLLRMAGIKRAPLDQDITQGFAGTDIPALYFDPDEAAEFRARFAASNRALAAAFMPGSRVGEDGDLKGRRYSDDDRADIRARIRALRLDRF